MSVVAIGLVTGLWPWRSHHGVYPRAVSGILDDGAHAWFTAHTPFDAGRFVAVDRDLKLAFFALATILAWTLICRAWALAAVAVGFLLFALPSTVLDLSAGVSARRSSSSWRSPRSMSPVSASSDRAPHRRLPSSASGPWSPD